MICLTRFLVLLSLCSFFTLAINAQENSDKTSSKIIFVLDASGSMWGKIGSEEKIVSAKRVLKNAIENLPENAEVGLIAYGHRNKSDCADIETLSTVKPLEKSALSKTIDALDPKGRTPITDSLRRAIAEVRALKTDETVKIVLISDGLETCAGDPCKLVREAKAAGVKITLHVIGFDTGKLNVEQLECVAQAGAGFYLNAGNAEQLGAALDEAVSAEIAEYKNFLSVKAIADGKLTDASVEVRKIGTTESFEGGRTYESADTNPRIIPLPAGIYDVTVRAVRLDGSPTIIYEKVEINEGETVEKTADFSAGELVIKITRNDVLDDASVVVFTESDKKQVSAGRTYMSKPLVLRLIPGRYYLEISPVAMTGAEKTVLKNVVVAAGEKQTPVEYNFESGTIRIGSKLGAELIDSTVNIIDPKTGKTLGGKRTYTNRNSNPAEFILSPGTYRIKAAAVRPAGLKPQEFTVTVKTGETVERIIDYK